MRTGVYATNDVHNVTHFCDATMIPDAWNAPPPSRRVQDMHIHAITNSYMDGVFLFFSLDFLRKWLASDLHLLLPGPISFWEASHPSLQKNGIWTSRSFPWILGGSMRAWGTLSLGLFLFPLVLLWDTHGLELHSRICLFRNLIATLDRRLHFLAAANGAWKSAPTSLLPSAAASQLPDECDDARAR